MKPMTIVRALVSAALLAWCGAAMAQEPTEDAQASKHADILRLLEITNALAVGQQMIDQVILIQRGALPDVPAEVWDELRKGFDLNEMVPVFLDIYDRNFTHEDIRGLLAFYESPLGLKLMKTQPQVVEESMAAGQKWAMGVLERLRTKLEDKGYVV